MLSTALAVATLASVSLPAHASYLCGEPTQAVGKTGTNPVVSTRVGIDTETKHWFVFHKLRDGTVIDRRLQYNMQSITERPGSDFGWSGFSTKNKDLWMFGAVRPISRDGKSIAYVEELRDQAHGDKLVMRSSAQCYAENATPAPVPQTPSAPPSSAPTGVGRPTIVPLITTDNHLSEHVTVSLGSQTVDMMLDTGAMLGTVSESVAATLIASGEANWNEDGHAILADGSRVAEKRSNIHRVTIGGRTVDNVLLGVVPNGEGMMLLGMQVLRTFGKFTIDAANDQLILG
jgi:predicted aspartyl protease